MGKIAPRTLTIGVGAIITIVCIIFGIGAYVERVNYEINNTKKIQSDLDKRIIALETAISIHHGRDWSEKVEKKTLKRVDDLENTMNIISEKFKNETKKWDASLCDSRTWVTALHNWTKQGDKIIKRSRLESFRSLAEFSDRGVNNVTKICVNKQHHRSWNFKPGDAVLLMNPLPPGLQIEVTVGGFFDAPDRSNILVQINKRLIQKLGLNQEDKEFELFIQCKPEALRWKTLNELYKIEKSKNL